MFVHSEYAEALTNPIKHVCQLDKRETQLAVLIEDNSEVRHQTSLVAYYLSQHFSNASLLPTALVQHVPNQLQEEDSIGYIEVFPGGPFLNPPPCPLGSDTPDIINLPTPGRDLYNIYTHHQTSL